MKFFIKDFCETMQVRVIIFGMQVDNDVLYCEISNHSSHASSSLYLFDFLSFHTLNDEFFVKDFCKTVQARVVIFGMQVDNDVLYCGIANQLSHAYSSLYLSFFPFPYFVHLSVLLSVCIILLPYILQALQRG